MISRILKSVFTVFILSVLVSCYGSWNFWYEGNNVDERTKSLKSLNEPDNSKFIQSGIPELSGQYTVLILSDTHFGNTKKEVYCNALFKWLKKNEGTEKFPAFAICLGDTVDLGKQEEYDLYLDFCRQLQDEYGIKIILNACGNHDIYQGNWENWEKNCYPHTSFYKFQTQNLSWYCLDTASGTIGINQYDIFVSDLKDDSRNKIVFTHYPFVHLNGYCANMAETTERNKLLSDFVENDVICVLGGHNHVVNYEYLGFNDYVIPSFGYAGIWGLMYVDEDYGSASVDFISE